MLLRNRRPNRSYTKAGRLIKIEPKRAKACQIIDNDTGQPVVFQEFYPGVEMVEKLQADGQGIELVPGFTSRKRARKVLQKLISVLEPGQPKRYLLKNLVDAPN